MILSFLLRPAEIPKGRLAGFAGVEGTKIIVFYPADGVSPIQKAADGDSDRDKYTGCWDRRQFRSGTDRCEKMFADEDLKKELGRSRLLFSSANSINIGRLVPQIAYYVYAYSRLLCQRQDQGGRIDQCGCADRKF